MLTAEGLARGVRFMASMKFFPAADGDRAGIIELLGEMCHDDEEVEWLARRMRNQYNEWPGPLELRAMLSAKRKPKDGIEAGSSVYPEGIPSEHEAQPHKLLPLPPGAIASADPEMDRLVRDLATGKGLSRDKPTEATKKNLYQFELNVHYQTLKMLGAKDLVHAISGNGGNVEYANRLWHGIFQDFAELRSMFPEHAERFGPYEAEP